MSKYDDTRIVTFQEDYKIQTKKTDAKGQPLKPARVLYPKGSTHAIHYKVVDQLKTAGGKFTETTFDYKKAEQKAKDAFLKNKKVKSE